MEDPTNSGTAAGPSVFEAPSPLRGLRLLLVEDDDASRLVLGRILSRFGAEVTEARSAADAILACAAVPLDAIVSDVAMPEMDGYELIRVLRTNGTTAAIAAIAVTAFAHCSDHDRALASGFDAHLSKPIDPVRLAATIRGVVDARRTEAATGAIGARDALKCGGLPPLSGPV